MQTCLMVSNSVFAALLFAYPADFRRRYGAEMASVFAESGRDAYQHRGIAGMVALWWVTAYDLLLSICAEHASQFLSRLRRDFRAVFHAPVFAAASGALVANVFFASENVLRWTLGLDKPPRERFLLLAIACLNLAALWVGSVFLSHLSERKLRGAGVEVSAFMEGVSAFRHLAVIALFVSLCPTLRLLILSNPFSTVNNPFEPIPSLYYWIAFPALLLTTISAVFFLQPWLTFHGCKVRSSSLPLGPRQAC